MDKKPVRKRRRDITGGVLPALKRVFKVAKVVREFDNDCNSLVMVKDPPRRSQLQSLIDNGVYATMIVSLDTAWCISAKKLPEACG